MLGTCTALGDIDMSTSSAFKADLLAAIDTADESFVTVDCSGVTFMGSAGYRVLVEATAYAAHRGHTLVIRNMSRSCARLLRLCEQDDNLTIEYSRDPR